MHEMGIASSILEAVRKETSLYPDRRAVKVGVVIGEYAGVDTESLKFAFDVLAGDQKLELAIEWRPGVDELKFAYLEMEEVEYGESPHREESLERERRDRGQAA
jgi:Zn finger protein HypA/HybF involved in hydrogenase expression